MFKRQASQASQSESHGPPASSKRMAMGAFHLEWRDTSAGMVEYSREPDSFGTEEAAAVRAGELRLQFPSREYRVVPLAGV